jgi:hypothetical protein
MGFVYGLHLPWYVLAHFHPSMERGHKREELMRKGGGKQKGAAFEREVCRELSLWMSHGKQEDVYWRSAMSGGRSTVAFALGKRFQNQAGDISCISPVGDPLTRRFLIECKSYAKLNFLGLLTGKGNLIEFWGEALVQAAAYNKLPLLIAKQNHMLPMACLCSIGARELELEKRALMIAPQRSLYIIPLHEFFIYAARPT